MAFDDYPPDRHDAAGVAFAVVVLLGTITAHIWRRRHQTPSAACGSECGCGNVFVEPRL